MGFDVTNILLFLLKEELASEIVQGCLKEEDITSKGRKQEYEENEGEGNMSETNEEENKIVISTKNTNIVINYR